MKGKPRYKSKKQKVQDKRQKFDFFLRLFFSFGFFLFSFCLACFGQQGDEVEFTLDAASATSPLPEIFKPNIDLSGRGFHRDVAWPQTLAARETLDAWRQDIGFSGLYRLQYNLWEISQLSKGKDLQAELLTNYEGIIKSITEAGGVVLLNLFGTPANFGRVLDKRSPPRDLKTFKALVKSIIRDLSCNKKYNIWYEVWTTPDLDDFFLGREQEYLSLYRAVAESLFLPS